MTSFAEFIRKGRYISSMFFCARIEITPFFYSLLVLRNTLIGFLEGLFCPHQFCGRLCEGGFFPSLNVW